MSAGELRSQSHEPLIYPTEARLARIQGTVVLAFDVNSEGVPVSPEVITGHPIFAAAAIRNLLTWRFARTPELATVGRQQARYLFEFSGTFTEVLRFRQRCVKVRGNPHGKGNRHRHARLVAGGKLRESSVTCSGNTSRFSRLREPQPLRVFRQMSRLRIKHLW